MAPAKLKSLKSAFGRVETAGDQRRHQQRGIFAGMYARQQFDWTEVDAATFLDGVAAACMRGTSVTISHTSDGGAVKVSVWINNNKDSAYAGDAATLDAIMGVLIGEEPDTSQESAD